MCQGFRVDPYQHTACDGGRLGDDFVPPNFIHFLMKGPVLGLPSDIAASLALSVINRGWP